MILLIGQRGLQVVVQKARPCPTLGRSLYFVVPKAGRIMTHPTRCYAIAGGGRGRQGQGGASHTLCRFSDCAGVSRIGDRMIGQVPA